MPNRPDWTPFLEAGKEFSALTRAEAQRLTDQLVREGQLAQDRAQTFVDELVESSKRRADELVDVVRSEFRRQVKSLGIATKHDLARLEERLSAVDAKSKKAAKRSVKQPTKATARKSTKKLTKKSAKAAKRT